MSLASGLRKATLKSYKVFGSDVTIRRVTKGTYNAAIGKATESKTDTTVKGIVGDINKKEVNQLIQSDDRLVNIAAASLTYVPSTSDKVIISGLTYQIIQVKTEERIGVAISYELILRG